MWFVNRCQQMYLVPTEFPLCRKCKVRAIEGSCLLRPNTFSPKIQVMGLSVILWVSLLLTNTVSLLVFVPRNTGCPASSVVNAPAPYQSDTKVDSWHWRIWWYVVTRLDRFVFRRFVTTTSLVSCMLYVGLFSMSVQHLQLSYCLQCLGSVRMLPLTWRSVHCLPLITVLYIIFMYKSLEPAGLLHACFTILDKMFTGQNPDKIVYQVIFWTLMCLSTNHKLSLYK